MPEPAAPPRRGPVRGAAGDTNGPFTRPDGRNEPVRDVMSKEELVAALEKESRRRTARARRSE